MNPWVRRRLARVQAASQGVVVLLDHDALIDPGELEGQVEVVEDWWSLRSTYERHGRRRDANAPTLVLVVRGPRAAEDLPWDIDHASSVLEIRLPGPPETRAALRELEDEELDRAAAAVAAAPADPAAALVRAVTDVDVGGVAVLPATEQLRVAARLAVRGRPLLALAALARRWVTDPVLSGLLEVPPDCSALQGVWDAFVAGDADRWPSILAQAKPEIGALFTAGLLEPVPASAPRDGWPSIGIRRPSGEERARELLAAAPEDAPTNAAGWYKVAEWWGDVRRLVASASTELREAAWNTWEDLDVAFVPWLRERYGTLLTSAAPWPAGVHRVAHFLARRVRDHAAERVLLIVLDGLGHAQFAHLRERLGVEVLESGSTMALVPTYTTVSRQAIFAGDLPTSSPDTLWTTRPEPRRWRDHWVAEGFPVTGVAYHRVKGRLPHDYLGFGDARVIGVVVNAVDDLMHTSELFGDAQLLANLDVWVNNGFLTDLIARATQAGIETWITADHGNLECLGIGAVSEGVVIESAGKRLLRYPNRTLRDASAANGIVWDDIPGLPSSAEPLLFGSGRSAFTNHRISISHGGLSIDEVIVPLAKVAA
jgi:PglZ domain